MTHFHIYPRDAACRDEDPELWFPLDEDAPDPLALAICAGCPVLAQCELRGEREPYGVWAAQTSTQRRRARQVSA